MYIHCFFLFRAWLCIYKMHCVHNKVKKEVIRITFFLLINWKWTIGYLGALKSTLKGMHMIDAFVSRGSLWVNDMALKDMPPGVFNTMKHDMHFRARVKKTIWRWKDKMVIAIAIAVTDEQEVKWIFGRLVHFLKCFCLQYVCITLYLFLIFYCWHHCSIDRRECRRFRLKVVKTR